jgi:hypothetical protein
VELPEAVLGVSADVIEEVIGVLTGGVGADQYLPAVVVEGRLDRLFLELHHGPVGPVIAVLGVGSLIDNDPMIAAAAAGDAVDQRPKVKTADTARFATFRAASEWLWRAAADLRLRRRFERPAARFRKQTRGQLDPQPP